MSSSQQSLGVQGECQNLNTNSGTSNMRLVAEQYVKLTTSELTLKTNTLLTFKWRGVYLERGVALVVDGRKSMNTRQVGRGASSRGLSLGRCVSAAAGARVQQELLAALRVGRAPELPRERKKLVLVSAAFPWCRVGQRAFGAPGELQAAAFGQPGFSYCANAVLSKQN